MQEIDTLDAFFEQKLYYTFLHGFRVLIPDEQWQFTKTIHLTQAVALQQSLGSSPQQFLALILHQNLGKRQLTTIGLSCELSETTQAPPLILYELVSAILGINK